MTEYKQTDKGGAKKQCKYCDIMFLRPDDAHIPDDACTRCHEEVEALKARDKKRPNKPLLREKLNSFLMEVFTRLRDATIFLSLCFLLVAVLPIVVGEALVRKRSVKKGFKKWKAYWVMCDLTWYDFKRTIKGE